MPSRFPARLATLCLVVVGGLAAAADWARFRGPNGAGISDDKNIPVQWTEKELAWKVTLPGIGNSSPIISKDRIFVHAASAKGDERSLICLDAATGKTVWTKTIPAKKAHTHNLNSLASSTPAADGERVYVSFWDGDKVELHAYDFAGKFLWKHDLGGFGSQHGAGASPVVYDDKVLILHDQDKDKAQNPARASLLVCLDAVKGKVVWEKVRPAVRACYSSPFVIEKAGKKELVLVTTPGVVAYDLTSGNELWKFDWKFDNAPLRTVGSAIHANDMLFAASGDGRGDRHFIALKLAEKGAVATADLAWENKKFKATPYVPCVLAHNEHLYAVNDEGFVSCMLAKTGKEVWKERLGRGVSASPILIDGRMYIVDTAGKVHVIEASPIYKKLAENDSGESVTATPAVADGRLIIRGRTSLICIARK